MSGRYIRSLIGPEADHRHRVIPLRKCIMKFVRRYLNFLGGADTTMTLHLCSCKKPPFHFADYKTAGIGEDSHGADISVSTCNLCGDLWLTYLIESPHYSRSGRWWRVKLSPKEKRSVSTATAREFVERSSEEFAGGNFFNSCGHPITAPIKVA